jgi:SAM-dependent methyltransferase
VVLRAVPPSCRDALDVGCGDGMLARRMRARVPHVVALDVDEPTLQAARADDGGAGVEYLRADLLTASLEPASFDLVASIAALHHVDAVEGLTRMAELVRPGGKLVVIGLARSDRPTDVLFEIAGFFAHRFHLFTKTRLQRRSFWQHSSPTVWPPPETYRRMRSIVQDLLPGVRFRRRALWRYSVVWTKPLSAG